MDSSITFGDLDNTLQAFGFEVSEVPGSHRLYRHAVSGWIVVLPHRRRDAAAHAFHISQVRSALVDFGMIEEDRFLDVVKSHRPVAS